jgi:hypothetical protein
LNDGRHGSCDLHGQVDGGTSGGPNNPITTLKVWDDDLWVENLKDENQTQALLQENAFKLLAISYKG